MENSPQYIYRLIPVSGSPAGDSEDCLVIGDFIYGSKYYGDFRLSDNFVDYILDYAICSRCMEIIGETPHIRTCEKPAKTDSSWSSPRNRMCYIPSSKVSEFKGLWERERRRWQKFDRGYKLKEVPLPPNEILLQLKDKQQNRCYYCFNKLETSSPNLKPHLDHFVSVANSGNNSILNLVYACGRCNREKCSENGQEFITKRMSTRMFPTDLRKNINKMRESVREWKEQF